MSTILKRALITIGVGLVLGVAFISPCVRQQPAVSPPVSQQHSDCDGSCALPPAGVPHQQPTKLVSQENWQFTLPGLNWLEKESPTPDIKVAISGFEPENPVLILFIKEEFNGTFSDYVISVVRSFAEFEFKLESIKQVSIDGRKFILVQAYQNDKVIWNWLTVKDNFGYSFTCGQQIIADAGTLQQDLCQSIADSLKIQ
jgi:hypothetical protein